MSDPMLLLLASACVGPEAAADMIDDHANRRASEESLIAISGSPGHARCGWEADAENEAWRKTGIEFGEPVDRLLRRAKLPPGWKLERTDHPMWNKLVDDRGRERAEQFHKAAFWDEDAYIRLLPRFVIRRECEYGRDGEGDLSSATVRYVVLDAGREVFATEHRHVQVENVDRKGYHERLDKLEQGLKSIATAWLSARYPSYEDVGAHWDEY